MQNAHSTQTRSLIELVDVSKSFALGSARVDALRHVHLSVEAGDFIAFKGPSGSGKTTLLNLIGCLDQPSSGAVRVNGVDTRALGERDLDRLRSRTIGFVFQNFNLVPVLSAVENVALPLHLHGLSRREMHARAREKLDLVGLGTFADMLPDQLSGGQRQRVSIARALAVEPLVVLADEPTANLDSKTAESILELLFALNRRGVTFVLATHDEALTRRVRRVVHVHDGIVSDQSPGGHSYREVSGLCGVSR
jgi:putative ABC transport system ATP-binding protein